MSRLYWRIFVSFWLVIVLTLTLAITGNSIVFRAELEDVRLQSLRAAIDALAEQAERELQQGGEPALRRWLELQSRERSGPRLLVIGPDERELLGRPLPPGPARAMERWQRLQTEQRQGRMRGRTPARPLKDAAGRDYLLFAAPAEPRAGGLFLRPQARSGVLLLAVLLSGLVCFLLARHLTRPVLALRAAGQRIAEGELSARVGPPTTSRQDELGALGRDFDRMAARLEQLLTAQQRLLRDVSHELRSPLARLQVAAGLLRQRAGESMPAELERIEREVERLDALIGQVLLLSRLADESDFKARPLSLTVLLADLVNDARYEAASSRRRVVLKAPDELMIVADQRLLRSAFDNVIRNALAHCREQVSIELEDPPDPAADVALSIQDDGPGVPPAELERIFEPFVSLAGKLSGRQGSGIGLAIARRAVQLHGGSIVATLPPEGGLRLGIRLPRVAGRPPESK